VTKDSILSLVCCCIEGKKSNRAFLGHFIDQISVEEHVLSLDQLSQELFDCQDWIYLSSQLSMNLSTDLVGGLMLLKRLETLVFPGAVEHARKDHKVLANDFDVLICQRLASDGEI